MESGRSSYKSW